MYCLNTKISLTMLCLSGLELYSRLVPLNKVKFSYGTAVRMIIKLNFYKCC